MPDDAHYSSDRLTAEIVRLREALRKSHGVLDIMLHRTEVDGRCICYLCLKAINLLDNAHDVLRTGKDVLKE